MKLADVYSASKRARRAGDQCTACTQHRLDRARQFETLAKSYAAPAPDKRHQRSRRAGPLDLQRLVGNLEP